jgi:hypothetical protein
MRGHWQLADMHLCVARVPLLLQVSQLAPWQPCRDLAGAACLLLQHSSCAQAACISAYPHQHSVHTDT